jgi:hypothetical protein
MGIEELDRESSFGFAAGVCLVGWWAVLLLAGTPWLSRMGALADSTPPPSQPDSTDDT